MSKDQALRLALEALEYPGPSWLEARQPAITAIKQALAQPVATNDISQDRVDETAKQRHEPLTDEEIMEIHDPFMGKIEFARAIEAAHGIKE